MRGTTALVITDYIQGLYKGARIHPTGLTVNQACSQVSTICCHFNIFRPKKELMENGNFCLYAVNRLSETPNFHLFAGTKFVFLGRQKITVIDASCFSKRAHLCLLVECSKGNRRSLRWNRIMANYALNLPMLT
jgi:hypothetical protein